MKKKVAASVKRLRPKPNKKQILARPKAMTAKKSPVPPPRMTFKQDPTYAQAVQNYEAGLKALQEHKFEKARPLLEKVIANGPKELADRARLHLNSCNQQLASSSTNFKSQDEHFDYAASLMNAGQFDLART